jgi:hypothetical protein
LYIHIKIHIYGKEQQRGHERYYILMPHAHGYGGDYAAKQAAERKRQQRQNDETHRRAYSPANRYRKPRRYPHGYCRDSHYRLVKIIEQQQHYHAAAQYCRARYGHGEQHFIIPRVIKLRLRGEYRAHKAERRRQYARKRKIQPAYALRVIQLRNAEKHGGKHAREHNGGVYEQYRNAYPAYFGRLFAAFSVAAARIKGSPQRRKPRFNKRLKHFLPPVQGTRFQAKHRPSPAPWGRT